MPENNRDCDDSDYLAGGGLSARFVLAAVSNNRKLIAFLVIGVTLAVAILNILLAPKRYSATACIVPPLDSLKQDAGVGSGLRSGGAASLIQSVMGVVRISEMYVGILESTTVADRLVERFNLREVYETGKSKSKAIDKLRGNTSTRVTREGIVSVTVRGSDPNMAAALANAYVEELDALNKKFSSAQATSKRIFLENRLEQIEQELSAIDQLKTRDAAVKEMLFEVLTREYEVARIEEAKSMPTIQVLDPATPPEMRMARNTARKAALAGLASFVIAMFVAVLRESRSRGLQWF